MPYFATKDGTKLYYEDYGQGATLLFSHGLNSSHLAIKNFIRKAELRKVVGLTKIL